MFKLGSHWLAGTIPDAIIAAQSPPARLMSQLSPSDNPEIVIVPFSIIAGLSPPIVPVDVVVTSVMAASIPEYGMLMITLSLLSPIVFVLLV